MTPQKSLELHTSPNVSSTAQNTPSAASLYYSESIRQCEFFSFSKVTLVLRHHYPMHNVSFSLHLQ